jgi:hypothetical protein
MQKAWYLTAKGKTRMSLICLKCGTECKVASCPACASREFKLIVAEPTESHPSAMRSIGLDGHYIEPRSTIDYGGFAR